LRRCDVAALGIYTVLGMFRTCSEHCSLLAQLESVASLTPLLTILLKSLSLSESNNQLNISNS
jgi:hypothetical protein